MALEKTCYGYARLYRKGGWGFVTACLGYSGSLRLRCTSTCHQNIVKDSVNWKAVTQNNSLNGCWLHRRSMKSTTCNCLGIECSAAWGSMWEDRCEAEVGLKQPTTHLPLLSIVGLERLDCFPFLSSIFNPAEIGKAASTTRPGRRLNVRRVRYSFLTTKQ